MKQTFNDFYSDALRVLQVYLGTYYSASGDFDKNTSINDALIYKKAKKILESRHYHDLVNQQKNFESCKKNITRLPLNLRTVPSLRESGYSDILENNSEKKRKQIDGKLNINDLDGQDNTTIDSSLSESFDLNLALQNLQKHIDILLEHEETVSKGGNQCLSPSTKQRNILEIILLCVDFWKVLLNQKNSSISDSLSEEQIELAQKLTWKLSFLLEPITWCHQNNDIADNHEILSSEARTAEKKFSFQTSSEPFTLVSVQNLNKKDSNKNNDLEQDFDIKQLKKYFWAFEEEEEDYDSFSNESTDQSNNLAYNWDNQMHITNLAIPKWRPVWDDTLELEVKKTEVEELTAVQQSLVNLRELTQQLTVQTAEDISNLEYIDVTLINTKDETQAATIELAEAAKTHASWWGLKSSGAAAIGGSILSLPLGPVGVVAGASIGGALGLAAGGSIRQIQNKKYDKIIKEMRSGNKHD